jgi:hypothetical protein
MALVSAPVDTPDIVPPHAHGGFREVMAVLWSRAARDRRGSSPPATQGIDPFRARIQGRKLVGLQERIAAGGGASDRASLFEGALLATGFLIVFLVVDHQVIGDGIYRFRDIQNLLYHGHLTYSHFSLVMPLASVPFLLLGHVVESQEWWAARFNVIVVAAGALAAWRLLRGRVDPALLRRTLLMLLAASLLANQLRDYNAEVFSGTLVALGILCIVTDQHTLLGWTGIVIAVVNTPALIVGVAALVAAEVVRTRHFRSAGAIAAAVALVLLENRVRHGGPVTSTGDHGYQTLLPYSGRPGFSYPLVLGLVSILFSFGRGLLFFTPGLFLWLDDATRRAAGACHRAIVLLVFVIAGLVAVYAKWWAWYGGLAWGPRYFTLAAIPAALIVVLRVRAAGQSAGRDALALVVLALSAWVGFAGLVSSLDPPAVCSANHYALESFCWYVPEYSSLWLPVLHPPPLTAATVTVAAWCIIVFAYFAAPLIVALARHAKALSPARS